ncbi:MAG: prepilin peptidase [Chloroflexi bacterium]|nr:prepilin peptidase [Chloroflexota bacterium]
MPQELAYPIALAVAGIAVYTDTRYGLIPNKLSFPAAGLGFGLNAATAGWDGAWVAAQAIGLGVALFLLPFLLGGMGAGDVKLLGALGALVGPTNVFETFVLSAMLGGVVGLVVLVRRFGWQVASFTLITDRGALVNPSWGATRMTGFPFASAIFFGLFASMMVS